jgi:FSR family fosmidomycin resistance protein-like MFS transporter
MNGIGTQAQRGRPKGTVFGILVAISFCHFMNDMVQSLIAAIYPILKTSFQLDFTQIGLITLTYQLTASLLQPAVGLYTDLRPKPFSLPVGMTFTLVGLVLLSRASDFTMLLVAAALVGVGSSVFHPESSRVARMASGGQFGLAQSIFQVGGNVGGALGPLLAAFVVLRRGQHSIAWFSLAAFAAITVLTRIGFWYQENDSPHGKARTTKPKSLSTLSSKRIAISVGVLFVLIFSKNFYQASLTSYYTFYLIDKFHLSVRSAQIHLFVFLGAIAAGTLIGGPVGDRIGRKYVIWISILGVFPFALALPYANLLWTEVLSVVIGMILASALPAIVVYAQELMPGRIGMMSGLFLGFAFGMAGIGAAVLGKLADLASISFVYRVCSFLPLIGLVTGFLPNLETSRPAVAASRTQSATS